MAYRNQCPMYNKMVLGTGSQWAYLRLWDPDPQPHKIRTLRPPSRWEGSTLHWIGRECSREPSSLSLGRRNVNADITFQTTIADVCCVLVLAHWPVTYALQLMHDRFDGMWPSCSEKNVLCLFNQTKNQITHEMLKFVHHKPHLDNCCNNYSGPLSPSHL